MNGSFKLGTFAGIPILAHWSFLLFLPILASIFADNLVDAAQAAGIAASDLGGHPWLWGLLVAVGLFASVLLHELAHAVYAVRRGGRVSDITLLMIGGVTQMKEAPTRPRDEALMALVGPATSLALGAMFLGIHRLSSGMDAFDTRFALFCLGSLNLGLGVFNLLPAFPMDGGRILRALLVRRMGVVRATRTAATVGKIFAATFAVLGFVSASFMLVLVGFFVYLGADHEGRQVTIRDVLGRLRVGDLMTAGTAPIEGSASVEEAAMRMIQQRRLALPVTESSGQLGILTFQAVHEVPPERRTTTAVREVARPIAPISADDDVWTAFQAMNESDALEVPVLYQGRIVGVLAQCEVIRGLQLQDLAEKTSRPGAPPTGRSLAHVA